jgi:hypothetical protein
MPYQDESIQMVREIKSMMERSSRFVSLSGLSGISAGICAIAGAGFANRELLAYQQGHIRSTSFTEPDGLYFRLILIAILVFIAAFISAFAFTYRRAKKDGLPVWDASSRRLFLNTVTPMLAGGLFIIGMLYNGVTIFVTSASLVFYGLALVNGSKYTLGEVKYLGYTEVALGLINMMVPGWSLLIWTIGFGAMHIVYGIIMWLRYERS